MVKMAELTNGSRPRCVILGLCFIVVFGYVSPQCIVANITTQLTFDVNKFQGKWYELYYIPKTYYEANDMWQDVSHVYTVMANGSVHVDFVWRYPVTGICSYMEASLHPTGQNGKFQMKNKFGSHDYWVLKTDYTSYAVTYGCRHLNDRGGCNVIDGKDVFIWSRGKTLMSGEMDVVNATLASVCVTLKELTKPVQDKSCEVVPKLRPDVACGTSATAALIEKIQFIAGSVSELNTTYSCIWFLRDDAHWDMHASLRHHSNHAGDHSLSIALVSWCGDTTMISDRSSY